MIHMSYVYVIWFIYLKPDFRLAECKRPVVVSSLDSGPLPTKTIRGIEPENDRKGASNMNFKRHLMQIASLLAFTISTANAFADPHSDGLELGKSNLSKLSSKVNNANAQGMPHYTNNPPQSQSFGSASLFDVGVTRINTCKTATHGTDQIANQECDAVNFLAKNPQEKVKFPVSPTDPIISGIGDTINNAKGGDLTNACTTKTTTTPDIYSTEVCNEYNLSEAKACTMGQIVQVDAKSNYQCNVTKNAVQTYTCDNYIAVACPQKPTYCDAGGITTGSVTKSTGAATVSFVPPYLDFYQRINTINTRETSTFQFNIENINLVSVFRLVYVQQDNWLGLKINGKLVKVFRAQLPDSLAYAATGVNIVWSGGRPYVDIGVGQLFTVEPGLYPLTLAVDLDMRQYLKAGNNTIEFILANGNSYGIGEAKFEVKQLCQPCTETWVDQCAVFSARSQ